MRGVARVTNEIEIDLLLRLLELGHLLGAWGHTVRTAASLDEALAHARAEPGIDLVLADHRLAHAVTGIETVDALRAALGREVAASIITGDTSPEALRGIQARGLRLMHKPLDEGQLRRLVDGGLFAQLGPEA